MAAYNPRGAIPELATHSNRDYSLSLFFALSPGFAGDPDPTRRVDTLDPLDVNFTRALRETALLCRHDFYGEPMTTVAYQYHRTDTTWYLIVAYNGYLYPEDIPAGTRLKIPDPASFKQAFQRAQQQAGRRFIF